MSILGNKLSEIIKSNDINIYQLSKRAGINRTTIHKIMTTERKPLEDFMKKLLAALPVTPSEKEEIKKAYEIHKAGEYTFTQRQQIQDIVSHIPLILDLPLTQGSVSAPQHNNHTQQIEMVCGNLSVNNLIEDIINIEIAESKNPAICFSFPHDYSFFYEFLFMRYSKACNLKLNCLIEFNKKQNSFKKRNESLDILKTLLPFLLHTSPNFNAYYLYSECSTEKSLVTPMPYYLITSKYVLTLTADLKMGFLYYNENVLMCYKRFFDDTVKLAQPLINRLYTVEETMLLYQAMFDSNDFEDVPFHCLEPQPCILHYCNREFIEKYVSEHLPNREVFVEATVRYCETIEKYMSNAVLTFSKEGLKHFLHCRRIFQIPKDIVQPFDNEGMLLLIHSIINDLKDDKINYRLINSDRLKISNQVNIDAFSKSCISFSTGVGGECLVSNVITITEDSIINAFQDFMLNMKHTDLLCSKEETLKVLYKAIEFIEGAVETV